MLNFDRLDLRYRPYPIGTIRPAMTEDIYAECLRAFPPIDRFEYVGKVGHKWSLSEKYAVRNYKDVIRSEPIWRSLHQWIKSREFIESSFSALRENNVDLGYEVPSVSRRIQRRIKSIWRGRGRRTDRYSTRFEFSMLPASGGCVSPHTDNPEKVITFVISMVGNGEWSADLGGGTDILQPKDEKLTFDHLNNYHPDYGDLDILDTIPFRPNQAIVFTPTFNSWHGVQAMTGPDTGMMRRSLTINIEAH